MLDFNLIQAIDKGNYYLTLSVAIAAAFLAFPE